MSNQPKIKISTPSGTSLHLFIQSEPLVYMIKHMATYANGWTKFHPFNKELEIRFVNSDQCTRFVHELEDALNVPLKMTDGYSTILNHNDSNY